MYLRYAFIVMVLQIMDRDNQIVDMKSKIQGLEHTVELKNSHIKENEDLLSTLNSDLRHSQSELSSSRIKCAELGSHIEELKEKLTETTQNVSNFSRFFSSNWFLFGNSFYWFLGQRG